MLQYDRLCWVFAKSAIHLEFCKCYQWLSLFLRCQGPSIFPNPCVCTRIGGTPKMLLSMSCCLWVKCSLVGTFAMHDARTRPSRKQQNTEKKTLSPNHSGTIETAIGWQRYQAWRTQSYSKQRQQQQQQQWESLRNMGTFRFKALSVCITVEMLPGGFWTLSQVTSHTQLSRPITLGHYT